MQLEITGRIPLEPRSLLRPLHSFPRPSPAAFTSSPALIPSVEAFRLMPCTSSFSNLSRMCVRQIGTTTTASAPVIPNCAKMGIQKPPSSVRNSVSTSTLQSKLRSQEKPTTRPRDFVRLPITRRVSSLAESVLSNLSMTKSMRNELKETMTARVVHCTAECGPISLRCAPLKANMTSHMPESMRHQAELMMQEMCMMTTQRCR
mmetsp:Transcript_41649/g.114905  ORF Transcript_41649/g.114905 Transcript_41649/m.114905 type:complete len:204 (+) Transcript_41649:269-880(+)